MPRKHIKYIKNYTEYRDSGLLYKRHPEHEANLKRSTKLKPSFRRWGIDNLLDSIKEFLCNYNDKYITAEYVANVFGTKKHLVEQVFHKLRLKGLIGQEINRAAHDSNRDPVCGIRGWSAWGATVYEVLKK